MRVPMNRSILFYVVMVCLLFPINALAIWGTKNARPKFVSSWPTIDGQRHFVIGYNNFSIPNTNNVLVVGAPNPISKVRDILLFEVIDGQIRQLASWSDLHSLNKRIGDQSYVLSLLADGQTIEVRDASTGEVVSKYSVPQDPLLPTTMASLDITYLNCCLRWRVSPSLHTDILTGQTLPIPVGSELLDLSDRSARMRPSVWQRGQ